jgi:Tetratricopeptide Repeats-Sensor
MRAFIIRPFGNKKGIDFDAVERLLIEPALQILGVAGRTTLDIMRQGNIRLDMFQRLLTADLVIADVSIYNANVFYELGIRHALRDKRTFLIRCERTDALADEVPFDLKTDRYFSYPKEDPASRLNDFVKGLEQTIHSEAVDSPVFMLLPELHAQPTSRFLPVPREFRDDVERAAAEKRVGDLGLLADEVKGLEWEIEGLRVIGRAQFRLKAFDNARDTWETIHSLDGADEEANELLATIYQRLGDLVRSDQMVQRVLDRPNLATGKRAESQALAARNAKKRWTISWERVPVEQRRIRALSSPYLRQSFDAYERAFYSDLNHFYAGVNALGMLTVIVELAESQPAVWATRFDTDAAGAAELEQAKSRKVRLADAVSVAVEAALGRLKAAGERDIWAEISAAEVRLLTAKRPPRVATAYQDALAGASDQQIDSVRTQVLLYQQLGIAPDNVSAALAVIPEVEAAARPGRVLLFTGHMIDAPTRTTPRFPSNKVQDAKRVIKETILSEQATGEIAYGIAGCASGGDILFHQVCEELGIPTQIFLALPRDQYVKSSVAPAGSNWVQEFDRLCRLRPARILAESKELPRWLQDKTNYTIWQRNNLWMLFNALAAGSANVTLIALWNGQAGDGPGGTADMVNKANDRGAKAIVLDTSRIFAT